MATKEKSKSNKKSESNLNNNQENQKGNEFDLGVPTADMDDRVVKVDKTAQLDEGNMDNTDNTIETLKQQLEALKLKSDRNQDLALRAKAELDNVRKRTELEVSNAHKYALDKFIPELFPLLDGLDQGLNTMPMDEQFNSVRDGLSLSIKMFTDVLVKFGVEILDPVNQKFDPAKHEAISIQPTNDAEPDTILVVVQKGYLLNNRVLRPARVIVAKKEG